MEKIFVVFDVEDQTLSLRIPSVTIRAGTKGLYWAKIFFDAAWQNMQDIKAGFFRNNDFHPVNLTADTDGSYICEIPPQVIEKAGQFSLGMFAGCQLITNTEFVPVLPSFKNEVFNNADFLDWFEETDKLLAEILEKAQRKANMTDVINEKSTAEQYPNAPAVLAAVLQATKNANTTTDEKLKDYVTDSTLKESLLNYVTLSWAEQALQEVDRVFNIILDEQTGIADKTFEEIQTALDDNNKVVTVNGDPIDKSVGLEIDKNNINIITAVVFTVSGADFVQTVQINADGSFVWGERDSLLRKSKTVTEISEGSTDAQYPTAKSVYTFTKNEGTALQTAIVTLLSALEERLTQNINGKSPINHNHNELYFTETEIINLLKGYVTTVNGLSGDVTVSTDSIGAEKAGTAQQLVTTHNTEETAHNDIRILIQGLTDHLNAVLDSDDETLDQMSEIIAYIKNNANLIAGVTTSKINYSDIVNDLVTNVTNKPLSAAQGVALKKLIDAIIVPTKLSELTNDTEFQTAAQVEAKLSLKAPSDHTHDERYFTQEAIAGFYNSLTRNPIIVTETVSGTSTVITCDHTLGQIQAYTGTPYVCYMLDVGADSGSSLVCFADLYSKSDTNIVFASAPDSNGHAHMFTVNSAGVTHTVFTAKPYFSAVPVIAEGYDDEIPNVFAVMNYVNAQTGGLRLQKAYSVKPASPAEGDIYYNTEDRTVQTYTAGAWTAATAADENTMYIVVEG